MDKLDSNKWENIFKEVEVIPLEFNSESMLSSIDKIIFQDRQYLVLDKKTNIIYKFDSKGKYISKLDKLGEGPDEYFPISDFNINPYSGNIELTSIYGLFYIYDINFSWLETIEIQEVSSINKFEYLDKDIITLYCSNDRNYNLWLYSRSSKDYVNKLSMPQSIFESFGGTMLNNPLANSSTGQFYCVPFINSIYSIKQEGATLQYVWDFGGNTFESGTLVIGDPHQKFIDQYEYNIVNGFGSLYNYFDYESTIFAQFYFKNNFGTMLYNKVSNKYQIYYDNYTHSLTIHYLVDGYISYTSEENLEKVLKNANTTFNAKNMIQKNHEPNPILLKYKFKETR